MNIPELLDEIDNALTHGTAERRAAILNSITDIFIAGAPRYSDYQIEIFDDIYVRLAAKIERSARAALARRLSILPRAPVRFSRQLAADDDIDVAGPILQNSEHLDTAALVATASTKTQQHLLAISRRSWLEEAVTDVLVERGDQPVVLSTANNPAARFSDAGYNTLVRRSEGDDELAASVGLRPDIPRQHLMRLLVQASRAVRVKLEAANPEMSTTIGEAIAEITGKILDQTGGRGRDYGPARAYVEHLRAAGELGDNEIATFAKANKVEETTAALAMLCELSTEAVERALAEDLPEAVLVMAKGCGLSWPAVKAILRMRAGQRGISPSEIEQCQEIYARLTPSTARQVIEFQTRRAQAQGGRFTRGIA